MFHVRALKNIQTSVIKPTNAYIQYVLSRIINYQHVLIAFAIIVSLTLQDY